MVFVKAKRASALHIVHQLVVLAAYVNQPALQRGSPRATTQAHVLIQKAPFPNAARNGALLVESQHFSLHTAKILA